MTSPSLARRCVAEALGTSLLVAAVVGSGIMAQTLCGGNVGLALLCNTIATVATLGALILTFGPISGAHFNPAVSLVAMLRGDQPPADSAAYIGSQVVGGSAGTLLAHLMFGLAPIAWSTHVRAGWPQGLSEVVATFGLIATILSTSRYRPASTPFAVSAFIAGAYWFTASTSFANPAVAIARCLTDTFAGIRPADVPLFVIAQLVGAGLAAGVFAWLVPVGADAGTAESRVALVSEVQS
jgi:glycerol uptake facilitator-like aquaporin